MLDPSYAGTGICSSSSSLSLAQYPRTTPICTNVRVYIDSAGEMHDPDYRDFPIFPVAKVPRTRSLGRRHSLTGRMPSSWARSELSLGSSSRARWDAWSVDQDLEEQDSDSDMEEDAYQPSHARTLPVTRFSSMTRAASPVASSIYSATSHMYLSSASITSAPAVLDREDEGKDWEEEDGFEQVDVRDLCEEPISGFASEANVVDLASPVEEGRSSTGRWSFLRRMMCTPSHAPSTPLDNYERSQAAHRGQHKRRAGRLQDRLRKLRSSSNLPPPLSHTEPPTVTVKEEFVVEKQDAEDGDITNEYLLVDKDTQEDDHVAQFIRSDREASLRRRAREMNLHVQTRLFRAKKDISNKMRYPAIRTATASKQS